MTSGERPGTDQSIETRPPAPAGAGKATEVRLGAATTPDAAAAGPGRTHTDLPVVPLVLGIAAVTLGVTVVW